MEIGIADFHEVWVGHRQGWEVIVIDKDKKESVFLTLTKNQYVYGVSLMFKVVRNKRQLNSSNAFSNTSPQISKVTKCLSFSTEETEERELIFPGKKKVIYSIHNILKP